MDPSCDCGLPAVRRQCKNGKPQNVGRFFWGCTKSRDYGGCSFFLWEADDVPPISVAPPPTGAVARASSSSSATPLAPTSIRRMANNEPIRRVGLPQKRQMMPTAERDAYVADVALVGRVHSLEKDRQRDRAQLDNMLREVTRVCSRVTNLENCVYSGSDAQPHEAPEEGEIVE